MTAESITNRKALRDYRILERYEAGIELKGSEVKSIRAGKANISDAFVRIEKGQAFLYNADIQPYERASHEVPAPKRVRQLGLGHRPLVETTPRMSLTDIALKEIIAGKLAFESLEGSADGA